MTTVRDILREGPATSVEIACELGKTVRQVSGCLVNLVASKRVRNTGRRVPRLERKRGRYPILFELVLPERKEGRGPARKNKSPRASQPA